MPALLTSAVSEPSSAIHRVEQPHDLGFDRHVRADSNGTSSGAFDLRDDTPRGGFVGAVVHADRVAALGGEARRRGADAAAGASNEEDGSQSRSAARFALSMLGSE